MSQTTTGAYDLALEYAYDLSGRMTSESRTENGATLTSSYIYDALGQLTSFTRSDGQSETYAYDPVGNMTAKTRNGVSTAMRYNAANQLIQSVTGGETTKYSYDANGNLTRSENAADARSYAYNALNLLESFTREDGYSETYSYNANRLLSSIKTNEDLTTTLTWDILYGDGVVIGADQNGKSTSYTYGLERISALTGKTRTEYVYDGRGSVAAEVSYNDSWYTFGGGLARKNVVSKSYSPFGELLTEQTSGFGYNGEYYNAATGMIYLRARFYEPELNRFAQKDILRGSALSGTSLNRYLYCQNDPVNYADPSGMRQVAGIYGDGTGRTSTAANQTTPIVTKPGKNKATSAAVTSRMAAVPVTDTGTGGYRSAASAASGINPANDNSAYAQAQRDREALAERGVVQHSPSVRSPVNENQGCSLWQELIELEMYNQQQQRIAQEQLFENVTNWIRDGAIAARNTDHRGTLVIGVSFSAGFAAGGGINAGIGIDNNGNIGLVSGYSYGGAMPTLSASLFASTSNAHSLAQLGSTSLIVGGTGGEVVTGGAEFSFFGDESSSETYVSGSILYGLGIGTPVELHGEIAETETLSFNIYDVVIAICDFVLPEQ